MGLDQLRQTLLYNRVVDVWIALSEEKDWDWYDIEGYKRFMRFLKEEKLPTQKMMVCVKEEGKKAMFLSKVAETRISHDTYDTYAVRLDRDTMEKIRTFQR